MEMKFSRILGAAWLTLAASAISQTAAAQLVLDDFSTGAYKKQLASGTDVNVQTGSMIGGHRETAFLVCAPGPCGLTNQFGQTGSIQVRPATKIAPAALIYSAGFKVSPRVDVVYGSAAPLNLALAPTRATWSSISTLLHLRADFIARQDATWLPALGPSVSISRSRTSHLALAHRARISTTSAPSILFSSLAVQSVRMIGR
jgi:hypothetical protein